MLSLGLVFCLIWLVVPVLQYLFLCLSYIIGAIASILIREWVSPSFHSRQIRLTALFSLTLLVSIASFYLLKVSHPGLPGWVGRPLV